MKRHRLRWALLCVAASPGVFFCTKAYADHSVVVGPGDSVDSLARKFHVSTRDIERANGITKESLLRDGRKLTIPAPPKQVLRPSTTRRAAKVAGDRVTFRLGPNEGYRRVSLLDAGKEIIVTGKAGDWLQAELPNGKIAWVRTDFISVGGAMPRIAAGPTRRTRMARNDDDEDSRPRARARKRRLSDDDRPRGRRNRKIRIARASSRRYHRGSHRRPEESAPEASDEVIRTAYAFRGVPYHYGGSSGRGFDCSGFTSYVYGKKGVNLPHSASGQFGHGQKVSSGGMKQGDLVFFSTTRRGISHVGIYVGDGKFVHASSGGGRVRVDTLQSGYYRNRFRGARRVK